MSLATVVLAAGAGRRFGGSKQLASVDGRPMLRRVLDAHEGFGDPQVLVLGAAAERVATGVSVTGWKVVLATNWELGPGASLRAGLATTAADSVLIGLGDLPWLDREAVERVLAAAAQESSFEAVRAFEGDSPGHPLLLRGALLQQARRSPDAGMREVLAAAPLLPVQCEGLGVARDVDRPADIGAAENAEGS